MKYFDTFLVTRIASFAAVSLLIGGLFELWTASSGNSGSGSIGVFLVTIGAGLAGAAIAALIVENGRHSSERTKAIKAALRLSHGEILDDLGDGELLGSIGAVADRISRHRSDVERIAEGRWPVTPSICGEFDELGQVIDKFASVQLSLAEIQEERKRFFENLARLTDMISAAAGGNLTIRVRPAHDAFGEVAQAFNSFTENVRHVLLQVQLISEQTLINAGPASDMAEQLARSCIIQASQAERAVSAGGKISSRIKEVDGNAASASLIGTDFLQRARAGARATEDSIGAMHFIRRQVHETSKRVKRLGERSQEIAQIVGLIDDLSDKTSLLALNATLQASASGEAGAAFVAIADEVERLAERSRQLTVQAAEITQAINVETKEAVASMDDTIREVVVGSALSEKAGNELAQISAASQELSEVLGSFSDCAKDQAAGSEELTGALSNISEAAAMIGNFTRRTAESNQMILKLSEELREAGTRFCLSASEETIPSRRAGAQIHLNGHGFA